MMSLDKWIACGVAVLVAACEPASITDAHNQLGAGRKDTLHFTIPITQDSFRIADFLSKTDTLTTASGVVGVKLDAESVKVNVGQQLKFNNLNFDPFSFGYGQMLSVSPVSTGVTLPSPPAPTGAPGAAAPPIAGVTTQPPARFTTAQGSTLVSATVSAGFAVDSIVNNTTCTATNISLAINDSTGAPRANFPLIASLAAGGGLKVDSVTLAAVTVSGFLTPVANASFGVCVPTGSLSVNVFFRNRPSLAQPVAGLTLASVTLSNVNESFTSSYSALASEARIQAVDTVVVSSGTFTITAQNRLPVALTDTLTLNGIKKAGATVVAVLTVPAASGTGTTTSGVLNIDLAGATIEPTNVNVAVKGVAKTAGQATFSPTVTNNAVLVGGTGNLVIQSLAGKLDPTKTPELTVAVQNSTEMPSSSVDFGDFGDAVKDSATHLNDATASLTVRNTAATPLALINFTLGAVQLDAAGNLKTKAGGALDYEVDAAGQPILVSIVDPGKTTLAIARSATTSVALPSAPLIDRVVHLVLNKTRVAIVAAGNAQAGDAAQSRIISTDNVAVTFALTVGLDFNLPLAGVAFTRNQAQDGASMESKDADEIAGRIINGGVTASVTNGTPFGLTVNVAFVDGTKDSTVDIFTTAGHVTLDSVALAASTVDAQGRVTQAAVTNASITMSGAQARPLLGKNFTVGVRIRLKPAAGGRGAIRPTDQVKIFVRALLDVRGGAK